MTTKLTKLEVLPEGFALAADITPQQNTALQRYTRRIWQNLVPNTRDAYIYDTTHYWNFCIDNGLFGLDNDTHRFEETLEIYIKVLCESELQHATIKRRLSSLNMLFGAAKIQNPLKLSLELKQFVKLQLQKNEKWESQDQAEPLKMEHLLHINEHFPVVTLLDQRDLVMVNMMYDALLRASDTMRVKLEDIDFQKSTLFLQKSKSDQSGRGQYRHLSNKTLSMISDYVDACNWDGKKGEYKPVGAFDRLDSGILFRAMNPKGTTFKENENSHRTPLPYISLYKTFNRLAKKSGLDIKFSTHSPRVGSAVTMAEDGENTLSIQQAGGWKSDAMVKRYTEQAATEHGAAARMSKKYGR